MQCRPISMWVTNKQRHEKGLTSKAHPVFAMRREVVFKKKVCASSKLTCFRLGVFPGRDGEVKVVSRSDAMLHDPTGDPCPKSWAVAHHLSPTSCQWGFLSCQWGFLPLPSLLHIPFQKQPDQKLMKLIGQYMRSEQALVPSSPLIWELSHDPGLPSSLHQSWVLIKPVDTSKSAKKMF